MGPEFRETTTPHLLCRNSVPDRLLGGRVPSSERSTTPRRRNTETPDYPDKMIKNKWTTHWNTFSNWQSVSKTGMVVVFYQPPSPLVLLVVSRVESRTVQSHDHLQLTN